MPGSMPERSRRRVSAARGSPFSHWFGECVQLPRGILQVVVRDDVVALEHGSRLVSRHGHRHALDDSCPHESPDRGSAEVVGDAAGTAGRSTGRLEGLGETEDGHRALLAATALRDHPEKHPRHDDALGRQRLALGVLRLQEGA